MRFVAGLVGLTGLWLLAWESLDPAKIMAGVVLAGALLIAMPARHRFTPGLRVRPLAAARLAAFVAWNLLVSTVKVAAEVLAPGRSVRTGVLTYPMPDAPPELVSTMANVVALTPDTLTVDATAEPPMVKVHFLRFDDPEAARNAIEHLDRLLRAAVVFDTASVAAPSDRGKE